MICWIFGFSMPLTEQCFHTAADSINSQPGCLPKSSSPSSFPMSLDDTNWRYLPHWQDLHRHDKEFDVLSSFSYFGIVSGLLTTLLLYRYLVTKVEKRSIRQLGGFPIFTVWRFFTERYDFIWENFRSDPSPHFKFKVLHVSPLFFPLYHWS